MAVMTNKQLAEKCIDIAKNYKTLYVMGGIGYQLTEANKLRAINNGAHGSYNAQSTRRKMISAADDNTWAFDCVCLIKSILWGWRGDKSGSYGGAKYASNNVPDINADQMINACKNVSTDFSKIEIGEAVWLQGHIGVYIGDGLAVECTPSWENCVQITACNRAIKGYNRRNWVKHGKLPYITYEKAETVPKNTSKAIEEVAREVINGRYGNGAARKTKLEAEGYNYKEVQAKVNEILSGKEPLEKVAKDTINGKYGNGAERKRRIPAETGYTYDVVQREVNKILGGK
jgi:hypothetical protein